MIAVRVMVLAAVPMLVALPGQGAWLLALILPVMAWPVAVLLALRGALRQRVRLVRFVPGSLLSVMMGGVTVRVIAAVVVAGLLAAGTIPRLSGQPWHILATVGLSLAAFALARGLLARTLRGQLRAEFAAGTLAFWSAGLAAGAVTLVLAASVASGVSPTVPAAAGPSAIVTEIMQLQSVLHLAEARWIAALRMQGQTGGAVAMLWTLLSQGMAAGWVCLAIAACTLGPDDIRRAFGPASAPAPDVSAPHGGSIAVVTAGLVLILAFGWVRVVLLAEAALAAAPSEARPATAFLRRAEALPVEAVAARTVVEVERIGGLLYAPGTIAQVQSLPRPQVAGTDLHEAMVAAIERGFDLVEANVDPFLDAYYTLGAEYARLLALASGALEAELTASLHAYLGAGDPFADAREAASRLEGWTVAEDSYGLRLADLLDTGRIALPPDAEAQVLAELDKAPAPRGTPDLSRMVETVRQRGFAAMGAGSVSALVAGVVVRRVVARGVLRHAAGQAAKAVAARTGGATAGAGMGAWIGGALGSVVPGAGTAAGAIIGGVIGGVVVGVSIDAIALTMEDYVNRDAFRAQIVADINAVRVETLALFGAP